MPNATTDQTTGISENLVKAPTMTTVGFIGLGTMGAAMARRLVFAGATGGYEVKVWNRGTAPVDELVADGAIRASGPQDVMSAEIVFSMLANDQAVSSVFNPELLAATAPGVLHINMATVSLETADLLATAHAKAGVAYIAAPVLGRPAIAAAGQLNIVASGDSNQIDRARPYLEAMGKRIWVVGSSARDANVVKIAVNLNLIHAIQALAESITLIEAAGVDSTTFVEILTDAAFSGSAHKGYGRLIAEQDYRPAFPVALGAKDLGLAEKAAAEFGIFLPSTPTLRRIFDATLANPALAELDWSAIAEVTRMQQLPGTSPPDA